MKESTEIDRADICCSACAEGKTINGIAVALNHMVLCRQCGNKRCPHAADHKNDCTGSNAPGQPGSNYPAPADPAEVLKLLRGK